MILHQFSTALDDCLRISVLACGPAGAIRHGDPNLRGAVAILTCITAVSVVIHSARSDDAVLADCKSEIDRFCFDVPHEAGAIPVCLSGHLEALSRSCKTALERKGPGWGRQGGSGGSGFQGRVRSECRNEIAEFCSGIEHGEGRVPACLEQHRRKLSHTCKLVLAIKDSKGKGTQGPKAPAVNKPGVKQ